MPANKPIVDAIKAKKQDPSGAFVWTTYAALQSLQAGLNQSDDPAEIAKYLKGATVDTVMGPLSWDQKGDLKGFEFGVFTGMRTVRRPTPNNLTGAFHAANALSAALNPGHLM